MRDVFDVIVVGGGGSGLAAAYTAAEQGGRVLLLERQPQLGGTTAIAVGSFTAAGTRLQRRAGIEDQADWHATDAGQFAAPEIEARNNEPLRREFLAHAAETFAWLESLGLSFVGPSPEPPNRVPRMHNVVPGAKAYVVALQSRLERLGAKILCNAAVTRLLRDEGKVVGVVADVAGTSREYRASRAVVLAAGDYASDAETIGRHKGDRFRAIEGINPHATGDGHRLVSEAGGQLVNMDVTYGPELRLVPPVSDPFRRWLPAGGWMGRLLGLIVPRLPKVAVNAYVKRLLVTWQHPENALFDDGAILLNSQGRRFVDERQWPEREIAVAEQPGKVAYLLLDGRLVERYSAWPHFISTAPDIAYAYVADYLRLRPDVTISGAELAEVAKRRGLDPAAVNEALEAYNRYVVGTSADAFGRAGDTQPLEGGPWVLLGPVKAYFTTTEGGAAIDGECRVLSPEGSPIPGLYAVGQNGLGGMVLWGHGLHIAWALTSGRLVGKRVMTGTDSPARPAQ